MQGIGVLGNALAPYQRHRQALGAVGVVKAETAFDAQAAVVGRAVAPVHADNFVVFDVVGQQAAHAAKRANRVDLLVHHLRAHLRFWHQRPGRAGLHTLATGHTAAVAHGVGQVKHNRAVAAAQGVADHVVDLLLTAGAHAALALDAGVQVDCHGRVRQVCGRLVAAQCFELGPHFHIEASGPVAEFAMLLRFVLLIPFVAGIGHVRQQHFQHHLLALERPLAGGLHLHARRGAAAAARGQSAFALDLDHTGAAIAVGAQAVFVAKVRNVDAVPLRGFEDGFALEGANGNLV